jgi:hypothetical protein
MNEATSAGWAEANQTQLMREFAILRERLGIANSSLSDATDASSLESPAALNALADLFELSTFERGLLLLCAGVEMDSALAAGCMEASGHPRRGCITFSLALAALGRPHWSALAPSGPLRRFRLIELEPGHGVTSAPLRIDERILHYLAGLNQLDHRLEDVLCPKARPERLAAEHRRELEKTIWPSIEGISPAAVLHLCGDDPAAQEDVAAAIAKRMDRRLFVLRLEDTPATAGEIDEFIRLWAREVRLLPASLLLQWEHDAPTAAALTIAERAPGLLMIASGDPLRLHRPVVRHDINKIDPVGQRQLWKEALGRAASGLTDTVDEISVQFRLSAETIRSIGASAAGSQSNGEPIATRIWRACKSFSRPRLEALAERIIPSAEWDDLVLPETQKQMLRQLAAQSRRRMTVYETWGFAAKGRRGLGLSALFSGPSGTGKTLAAEVIAKDLDLDLYRIDLSSVVSKYIGETEKNLKHASAGEAGSRS